MQNWMKKQRIGLSVKSLMEHRRAIRVGANVVELKIEKFAEKGTPLIVLERGGTFKMQHDILSELADISHKTGVELQWHHWIERCLDPRKETGINLAIREHHPIGLDLFGTCEEIHRKYGIGRTNTKHLSTLARKGVPYVGEDEAIEGMRIFAIELDGMRVRDGHETIIGFENQTDPKHEAAVLGFRAKHFKDILRDTRSLGITIDTGHRRLSQHHTVRELLQLGLPVVNFHFHGNDGTFTYADFDDDQHQPPVDGNIKGYDNYLRYFRRHRTPIILELSNLAQYSDEELSSLIDRLKRETE